METNDKERIEIAATEHSEKQHLYKGYAKMDFITGAEYERTIADQQLGLQEIELNHTKTLLASCEKALEGRNQQLAELKASNENLIKIAEKSTENTAKVNSEYLLLRNQLAGKDKEIEKLRKYLSDATDDIAHSTNAIFKQRQQITSLKEALRKARSFVGNSETHTLSDEKTVSTFIDEIENLLT